MPRSTSPYPPAAPHPHHSCLSSYLSQNEPPSFFIRAHPRAARIYPRIPPTLHIHCAAYQLENVVETHISYFVVPVSCSHLRQPQQYFRQRDIVLNYTLEKHTVPPYHHGYVVLPRTPSTALSPHPSLPAVRRNRDQHSIQAYLLDLQRNSLLPFTTSIRRFCTVSLTSFLQLTPLPLLQSEILIAQ